ncbi:diacylglycerol O-acyltransferase 1-like isoform X2 [Babylonia areolata]|uniref:diacylglycerol O-acyltransferase 1-like isoform X2 n=1 Tax=Babylonia areolata TaxID=304850 RepID=UPI003FCF12A4
MATRRTLQRTTSCSKVEHLVRGERQARQWMPDKPIHRNTDSLLSTASNFTNYRGLLNLCLLLLVLANARLCMENLIKYGVLINPVYIVQNCFGNLNNWPNAKILLYQGVHPLVAFVLQHLLSKGRVPEWLGVAVTFVNGTVQLVYPAWVVLYEHPNPVFSSFTLALVTVLFLKLISYTHVNYWCRISKVQTRLRRRQSSQSAGEQNGELFGQSSDPIAPPVTPIVRYPDNLTLKDLSYFVLAPTLCYELNFPRSARIRKRFFLKRLVEMIFLIMVIIGLVQQWIVPTIRNSLKPLSDMDVFKCCERLLKLAIPNHFIWLLFFYAFFHSMLNVMAELLKFGDRDFYQDWWNSDSISDFWKSWNIPVHRWATRHIYKPLRKRGYSPMLGSVIVFIVSAFFHEYLVSIPLCMFKYWAFMGMLAQVPLAYMTGQFFKGTAGNVVMWVSLIVGQPVAILAYVHDYYLTTVGLTGSVANHTVPSMPSAMHTEL